MVSLYQIEFMKAPYQRIIDESVSYAKSRWGKEVGNFVNAVLRNHVRYRDSLRCEDPSLKYSFPSWLVERWRRRFGDELELLLQNLNSPPKFSLRINLNRVRMEEVEAFLKEKGIDFQKGVFIEEALRVGKISSLIESPLFKDGLIRIQDEASQLAPRALGLDFRGRVLDACSGYGTKSLQLYEDYQGKAEVFSCDISKRKLRRIPSTIQRVACDITKSPFRQEVFDGILLDAPCSSLGIVRKHPEIKWRVKEEDLPRFREIQLSLIEGVWKSLKFGGILVYSVCSFEPEETVDVIERFAEKERFEIEKPFPFSEERFFYSIPHRSGLDGFFIARLRRI